MKNSTKCNIARKIPPFGLVRIPAAGMNLKTRLSCTDQIRLTAKLFTPVRLAAVCTAFWAMAGVLSVYAQLPVKELRFQVRDVATGSVIDSGEVEFFYNGSVFSVPIGQDGMVSAFFDGVTAVRARRPAPPSGQVLAGSAPNPFTEKSVLFYPYPFSKTVRFELFDLLGRRMVSRQVGDGQSVELSDLPAGIYFARIGRAGFKLLKTAGGPARFILKEGGGNSRGISSREGRVLDKRCAGYGKVRLFLRVPGYSRLWALRRKGQGPGPYNIAQSAQWLVRDDRNITGWSVDASDTSVIDLDSLVLGEGDSLRLYIAPEWLVTNDTLMTKTWGRGRLTIRRDSSYVQFVVTRNLRTGEPIGEERLQGVLRILESLQECLVVGGDTLNTFRTVLVDSVPPVVFWSDTLSFEENLRRSSGYSLYYETLDPPGHAEFRAPWKPCVIVYARQRAPASVPMGTVGAEIFGQLMTNDGYPPDPHGLAYALGAILNADGTASARAAAVGRLIMIFNPGSALYTR